MKVLKSFSVYVFTLFFTAGISFATFSLLTRYLNEVDYGIINLYSSLSILLTGIISCGVQVVLSVDYFSLQPAEFRKRFSNSLAIPVIIAVFFAFVFMIFNAFFRQLIKVNFFFVAILPLTCFLIFINEITLGIMRNKERHYLYAGYSIGKNFIEITLTILFVIFMGLNWQGRIGGSFITVVLMGMISFYLFRRWNFFTKYINLKQIKPVLKQGLPFIPERLAVFFMFYSDRFFIDHYKGISDVGFYSAGAQIAIILNLVCHSLNNTFYPYFYKRLAKPTVDYKGIRKGIFAFSGISTLTMIGLIIITPFIFKYFVGSTFQPGQKYAIYLIIGFFFWSIYNMLLPFLLNKRRNKLIMTISATGMFLSIILNFFNVRYFGALGATYTLIIVFATLFVLTLCAVHKIYDLRVILGGHSQHT